MDNTVFVPEEEATSRELKLIGRVYGSNSNKNGGSSLSYNDAGYGMFLRNIASVAGTSALYLPPVEFEFSRTATIDEIKALAGKAAQEWTAKNAPLIRAHYALMIDQITTAQENGVIEKGVNSPVDLDKLPNDLRASGLQVESVPFDLTTKIVSQVNAAKNSTQPVYPEEADMIGTFTNLSTGDDRFRDHFQKKYGDSSTGYEVTYLNIHLWMEVGSEYVAQVGENGPVANTGLPGSPNVLLGDPGDSEIVYVLGEFDCFPLVGKPIPTDQLTPAHTLIGSDETVETGGVALNLATGDFEDLPQDGGTYNG